MGSLSSGVRTGGRDISNNHIDRLKLRCLIGDSDLFTARDSFRGLVINCGPITTRTATSKASNTISASSVSGTPVFLHRITAIDFRGSHPRGVIHVGNGHDVKLSICGRVHFGAIGIISNIVHQLTIVRRTLPNCHFRIVAGRNAFVGGTVKRIGDDTILKVVLTIIVLFIFLHHLKAALVIDLTVPVSVITAFGLVFFGRLALGVVALNKLTLKTNVLISGTVMIVRDVFHGRRGKVAVHRTTVTKASRITNTIVTSALAAVIIFLPVICLRNTSKRLFGSRT